MGYPYIQLILGSNKNIIEQTVAHGSVPTLSPQCIYRGRTLFTRKDLRDRINITLGLGGGVLGRLLVYRRR